MNVDVDGWLLTSVVCGFLCLFALWAMTSGVLGKDSLLIARGIAAFSAPISFITFIKWTGRPKTN